MKILILSLTIPTLAAFLPIQGKSPPSFIIVGDMQRTSFFERIIGREQNDAERALLAKHIASRRPDFIALLGDLIFQGDSKSQWQDFDRLTTSWREKGLKLYLTLGNHEYYGNHTRALALVKARFGLKKSWHRHSYAGLGLIFLDSNKGEMSPSHWQAQRRWFRESLHNYDREKAIHAVLVFAHHPNFTNSTVTSDEPHMQAAFLKPFRQSRKTLAMFAGHVHSYERFNKFGKTFINSGGGGGPRVRLKRNHIDQFKQKSLRPFHYLYVTVLARKLEIAVWALQKSETDFFILERFDLPFKQ